MDPIYYLYIGLGVALLGYVALMIIKVRRNKKRKQAEEKIEQEKTEKNLEIIDDVRYTMETNPEQESGAVNATFQQSDLILKQNTPYKVSVDGEIKPGKYIMLSNNENQDTFNIRVGIYVREYKHNQEIVLAEGDTVCAVSGDVILR